MGSKTTQSALLITMGDPSGIGPEIVVKSFQAGVAQGCVVLGCPQTLAQTLAALGGGLELRELSALELARGDPGLIEVLPVTGASQRFAVGEVSKASGALAFNAIAEGIALAKSGHAAGLVTAPIHKEAFAAAGITYPGHTEILSDLSGAADVAMMLANDEIRTVLVTIHVSLRDAIMQADAAAQQRAIRLAHEACLDLGIDRPRVAVAGLNPHAGEGGLFGREEIEIIAPAIAQAQADGIDASGPWPGDTVFMAARQGKFDVVVAQYHDQGLIPVKYLGVEKGVNVTLGLPFVRTSPDHGTAFDIAGQGIADPSSMITAIRYARRLVDIRQARQEAG